MTGAQGGAPAPPAPAGDANDCAELLVWLRERRDESRQISREYTDQGDEEEAAEFYGRAEAFGEMILHVQYG